MLPPPTRPSRVIVALSGGVDSAVAALLLKQAGYDVHALHMTNWEDDDGYCTAAADLQDARNVCRKLEIPLHHVNFAREYRDQVFAHFLDEYAAGRTPNPDILCNREIKFGVFFDYAQRLGGDLMATGHYAHSVVTSNGEVHLLKAADHNKDQSYFLHAVPEQALKKTLFPLATLTKAEIRALAYEHGLVVHDKKDSTGICFIGERPFREFLQTYLPAKPGPILDLDGNLIGEHHGLMYYTIGQRQGLGIGGRQSASDAPWYVVEKRVQENALLVVQGDHPQLYATAVELGTPHWIGSLPEFGETTPLRCQVKVRYRQPDQACEIYRDNNGRHKVLFAEPQRAVANGQYAVFYQDERCLGGAVIEQTVPLRAQLPVREATA